MEQPTKSARESRESFGHTERLGKTPYFDLRHSDGPHGMPLRRSATEWQTGVEGRAKIRAASAGVKVEGVVGRRRGLRPRAFEQTYEPVESMLCSLAAYAGNTRMTAIIFSRRKSKHPIHRIGLCLCDATDIWSRTLGGDTLHRMIPQPFELASK